MAIEYSCWHLLFPMTGFAQAIQVKGTVLDASGMSVIGASVLEKWNH